jgi:hypothetical protein
MPTAARSQLSIYWCGCAQAFDEAFLKLKLFFGAEVSRQLMNTAQRAEVER